MADETLFTDILTRLRPGYENGGLTLPKSNIAGINVVSLGGGKYSRPNRFKVQIRGTTDAEGNRPVFETKEFNKNKQGIKAAKDYIEKSKIILSEIFKITT